MVPIRGIRKLWMITPQEIHDIATFWRLPPETIEKDFVLGWVLWGISTHATLSQKWVFKGGTCIKKCFANTHRYSEDLDFTVLKDGPFKPEDLYPIFSELLPIISAKSGIKFDSQEPRFDLRPSGVSTEGRIYFNGPRQTRMPIRIKLDLTIDEIVARPPVLRIIDHPYSDALPDPKMIRCYNLEEVFAEKIRAMSQRGRPRDLYDIVFLSRRSDLYAEPNLISSVLEEKCTSKGIPVPSFEEVTREEAKSECDEQWENMLGHQLGYLPSFNNHWDDLERFFNWLEYGEENEKGIDPEPVSEDEKWSPPPIEWQKGQSERLEPVRFAAVNRLCLSLGYNNRTREVEPYSLRRTQAGNVLFYALRQPGNRTRAYRIDRIQSIEVLPKPFDPVFPIEFTPDGRFSTPPVKRRPSTRRIKSTGYRTAGFKTTYIIQCPYCNKTFRRTTRDFKLRSHKQPNSNYKCPGSGRRGYHIDTRY